MQSGAKLMLAAAAQDLCRRIAWRSQFFVPFASKDPDTTKTRAALLHGAATVI